MSAATTDLDVSCYGRAKRQLARGLARAAWPDGGETMSRVPRLARLRAFFRCQPDPMPSFERSSPLKLGTTSGWKREARWAEQLLRHVRLAAPFRPELAQLLGHV